MGFHTKNVSMIQSKLATFMRLTPRSARRQRARTEAVKTARTSRSLPKRFWQNLALIAVPVAVLVGIETYHATTILPDLARSRAAVAHTLQVIDAARTLDETIQDAQRGERGFIITGNLEYLEPYTDGIKDAPARLTELKKLTEDNPDSRPRQAAHSARWRSSSCISGPLDNPAAAMLHSSSNRE